MVSQDLLNSAYPTRSICNNFSLNWPILVIFLANMVIFHVPMGPMMTRSLYMNILVGRIGLKDDQSTDTIGDLYYEGMDAGGGTKRQLFGNFLAFSESSHQLGPEKPCGARKSQKFAKWVTLVYFLLGEISNTKNLVVKHD